MSPSLADASTPTLLWGDAHPRPGKPALAPFDYTQADDRELASLATQGREPAFRELLSRYERPVFSLVFRMVRDRELAEDLTQETFVKALNAVESYRPEFKFSSWIFKIANNAAIDHLRRRELQTLSLEGSPNALTPEAIEVPPPPRMSISGTKYAAFQRKKNASEPPAPVRLADPT